MFLNFFFVHIKLFVLRMIRDFFLPLSPQHEYFSSGQLRMPNGLSTPLFLSICLPFSIASTTMSPTPTFASLSVLSRRCLVSLLELSSLHFVLLLLLLFSQSSLFDSLQPRELSSFVLLTLSSC